MANTLVIGPTRKGKTYGQIERLCSMVGKKTIIVIDPQDSLSEMFISEVVGRGLVHRVPVLVDFLSRTDRALGYKFLHRSTSTNPIDRMAEDEICRWHFASMVASEREEFDFDNSPLITEMLFLAIQMIQYQKTEVPEYLLPYALRPGPVMEWLIDNCTDQETRSEANWVYLMKRQEWRKEVAPAWRMAKRYCLSAPFVSRCGHSFDFGKFMDQKGILIIQGGKIARKWASGIGKAVQRMVFDYKARGESPVEIVMDEAASFGLVDWDTAVAYQTLQKTGLDVTVITQSLTFEDRVNEALLQNSDRKEIFGGGSPETRKAFAQDIARRTYDPLKVKYQESHRRQVHAGYQKIRGLKDTRTTYLSDYSQEEETTDHYYSTQEMEFLKDQEIAGLGVGWRYVIEGGRVFKEKVPALPKLYPLQGFLDLRVREWIAKTLQRPEYQTPTFVLPQAEKKQGAASRAKGANGSGNGSASTPRSSSSASGTTPRVTAGRNTTRPKGTSGGS